MNFGDDFRAQATLMENQTLVSLGEVLQIGRQNHEVAIASLNFAKEMLGKDGGPARSIRKPTWNTWVYLF